ncbi:MAG: glycosyltransferase [Verrucomicrobiota bacterium]
MRMVIFGLSITSSWGNGHATTYRGLVRELSARGHDVLFLERDVPWYADHRDLEQFSAGRIELYRDLDALRSQFHEAIAQADFVMIGSFVPEGVAVAEWVMATAPRVVAFYDIDTPVTLGKLQRGEAEYINAELIPRYHLYLSFSGGPTLEKLEQEYGSPMARPLYCSVDPESYFPEPLEKTWDLGYIGTYSTDRQPALQSLLIQPARRWPQARFVVAGPQYPPGIYWPSNVDRIEHLPPNEHRQFYNAQRYTLNVTRAEMIEAGYSPSVRLFEAAACGTPIISDYWEGLEEFFELGEEILIARSADYTLRYLQDIPESERREIAERARKRVLEKHTAAHRASELESYIEELLRRQEQPLPQQEIGSL